MTDHLTEAVRRLRQLQEDVERLKTGGDKGELREIRTPSDTVAVDDIVATGADAAVSDAAVAADVAAARRNDAEAVATATATDTATATTQTATPAVCDFDNADKSDAG